MRSVSLIPGFTSRSDTCRRENGRVRRRSRRAFALEQLEIRRLLATLECGCGGSAAFVEARGGAAEEAIVAAAFTVSDTASLAPPTGLTIGWNGATSLSDAVSFDFGTQPLDGVTWRVLENGAPIAVNTRYYLGLTDDTWQTDIAAVPFSNPVTNPVILPTAYGLRAQTAGNRYEIELLRDGETVVSEPLFGRFKGATGDGVGETQAGTISLLDLDAPAAGVEPPAGVTVVRAAEGEQVAALIVDAGSTTTLRIGELGVRSFYTPTLDVAAASLEAETNRSGIIDATLAAVEGSNEWTLTIDAGPAQAAGGLVSVRIVNTAPGDTVVAPRYLGVIVRDAEGAVPGRPKALAVGAVNTNDSDAQNFFRGTSALTGADDPVGFKQFDSQYVYLNGGPLMRPTTPVTAASPLEANPSAWQTSSGGFDGKKLVQSVRESMKFGAVPHVVYYNIMTPDEGQAIALANLQNRPFMVEYFKDLRFAVETIRAAADGATVALILEPDLLAYMMQSARQGSETYADPATIPALTEAAYEAGLLPDPGPADRLPNTLPGFVEAINRGVRYLATTSDGGREGSVNLEYGWKFNLWAYDAPSAKGLVHATDADVLGWPAGRAFIEQAGKATADWYIKAGILTGDAGSTMNFLALDKYGTDGGATGSDYPQNGAGYTDPTNAPYFYNADHWNNYLLYAKTLHESIGVPVRLWQIPVGHVNTSQYGVAGQQGTLLPNVDKAWEDSAPTYFFGDTFTGRSAGRPDTAAEYFLQNQAGDGLVKAGPDGTIVWGSHMAAARDAGVEAIMFGPGLANSTQGGGYQGQPTDGYWWAGKADDYLKNPLPLSAEDGVPAGRTELHAHAAPVARALQAAGAVVVQVTRTGDTSRPLRLPIRAVGGSAAAGSDYVRRLINRRFARFAAGEASTLVSLPLARLRSHQAEETLELRIGGRRRRMPVVRATVVLGATQPVVPDASSPAPLIAAQPDDQGQALLDLLASATRSIDIVIYQIGDPEIASRLLDRMAGGVNVRLVLDASSYGNVSTNSRFVDSLREAMASRGIASDRLQAHWSSENFSITHQKSVIIDAVDATGRPLSPDGLPDSARVLISSGNFATSTQYGPFWKQRNFYVTVAEPAVVAEASRVFVSDFDCDGRTVTNDLGESSILVWSNGTTNRFIGEQGLYPSDGVYYPATEAGWDSVSLIPQDEGNVVAYQVGLIEQARAGDVLRIYTLEFVSTIIASALNHAAGRGVDVRLVTTYEDDNDEKKANLSALATAGGTVTYFAPQDKVPDALYIHAKAMLLSRDDIFMRGFVGSQNFSDPSMQFNRELGIPLDLAYADVAARIGQSFDADFTFQGGTPDLPVTAQLTRSNPSTVPAGWLGSTAATTFETFVRPGCGCVDQSLATP